MGKDVSMSRRQGLTTLGLTLGAAVLGSAATPASAGPATTGRRRAALTGTPYSVTIVNNSKIDDENAIVFQQQPSQPADMYSLAWLSKMCHAGTSITFKWTIDYNFVWGQTGTLKPGVDYEAGQIIPADLQNQNMVTLSYIDDGFEFGTPTSGAAPGSLLITEDETVPGPGLATQGSVGIGMSGAGTFVVPTQPKTGAQFLLTPTYWLAFGSYKAGTVVTEDILTEPYQLKYPDGETDATAVFDGENWTITFG
ncbi:hypothetical protein [Micromonospora rosaria]|uniref:hypothetical protein n=1 Tax=Micromonospora rosaria TaxID=47874 RepID=UPI000A88F8E8|nr:hypothetical protein [Micromonospora rosaria]